MGNEYPFKGKFEDLCFKEAVRAIMLVKSKQGIILTEEDIRLGLSLSKEQFFAYLNNTEVAPKELNKSLLIMYNIKIQYVELISVKHAELDDLGVDED